MHYEDIKLKQSTYAIISFNDWGRLGRVELAVWYPGGLPQGRGGWGWGRGESGWQQPLWIYVSLCSAQTCLAHISSKESISQMCTTVSHNYIRAQWQ